MAFDLTRRTALKGLINGAAVAVGVPLLDCFLDGNGEALAAQPGAPVPVRFGTWFWGLGVNPSRWFPTKAGADYDLKPELAPIARAQAQDQRARQLHRAARRRAQPAACQRRPGDPHRPRAHRRARAAGRELRRHHRRPASARARRFRSLELSATGDPRNSLSGRGGGNLNPSEVSRRRRSTSACSAPASRTPTAPASPPIRRSWRGAACSPASPSSARRSNAQSARPTRPSSTSISPRCASSKTSSTSN